MSLFVGKINPSILKDLLPALVSLGLNMMEQEVIDMTNTVARNGLVYFPEFCAVVLKKFREEDEEQFSQIMFKVGIKTQDPCCEVPHGITLLDAVWY